MDDVYSRTRFRNRLMQFYRPAESIAIGSDEGTTMGRGVMSFSPRASLLISIDQLARISEHIRGRRKSAS